MYYIPQKTSIIMKFTLNLDFKICSQLQIYSFIYLLASNKTFYEKNFGLFHQHSA